MTWPLPPELSDQRLEAKLYRIEPVTSESRPLPDWQTVAVELRKKHVTLALLWQEYWDLHSSEDAYGYSRFCDLYREWSDAKQPPVFRQTHKFGDKVFVDFAGDTIPLVCPVTGQVKPIHLFVAVLGGSNYSYIEATHGEDLTSWIGAHVRMFDYFGGCPEVIVPDNLKSGVTKADFYDPQINPTYQALADHYGVAILPARKRKPRDKAKVEQGVLLAERWVIAVLRNRTFYDFEELRTAVWELNDRLNEKKFRKIPGCRRTLFEDEEKGILQPLPSERFALVFRKSAKVYLDYHVEFEGQFFSVPHQLTRRTVEIRYTARIVEIFYNQEKVATHERIAGQRYMTNPDHMPSNHRFLTDWNPERFLAWAAKAGPATRSMIDTLLAARRYPEHSYRACLGILQGLPRQFGADHKVLETCQQVLTELFQREQRNNEKSKDVLGEDNPAAGEDGAADKRRRKGGNGRHPRTAFTNADDVDVLHPDLKPGDPCPCGCGYKLYALAQSSVFRSFRGHVPIKVTFYHLQQLKSAGCDRIFKAPLPEGIGPRHYEPSAITMFILMRYGFGLPMYRSSMMLGYLGVPLAVSTQYGVIAEALDDFRPVHNEMLNQAAQGEVGYQDDTTGKILNFQRSPEDQKR